MKFSCFPGCCGSYSLTQFKGARSFFFFLTWRQSFLEWLPDSYLQLWIRVPPFCMSHFTLLTKDVLFFKIKSQSICGYMYEIDFYVIHILYLCFPFLDYFISPVPWIFSTRNSIIVYLLAYLLYFSIRIINFLTDFYFKLRLTWQNAVVGMGRMEMMVVVLV